MKCRGLEVRESYEIQAKSVNPYNNSFEMLTQDLKRLKRNGYRVVLLSGSRTRAKRLAEDLRDYNLSSYYGEDIGPRSKAWRDYDGIRIHCGRVRISNA